MKKCKSCGTKIQLRIFASTVRNGKRYIYYKCTICKIKDGDNKKTALRVRKWRKENPEKNKARKLVENAMKRGDLKKQVCEVCKSQKVEAHHEDYTQPLQVNWLCKKHHIQADKKRRALEK